MANAGKLTLFVPAKGAIGGDIAIAVTPVIGEESIGGFFRRICFCQQLLQGAGSL